MYDLYWVDGWADGEPANWHVLVDSGSATDVICAQEVRTEECREKYGPGEWVVLDRHATRRMRANVRVEPLAGDDRRPVEGRGHVMYVTCTSRTVLGFEPAAVGDDPLPAA